MPPFQMYGLLRKALHPACFLLLRAVHNFSFQLVSHYL